MRSSFLHLLRVAAIGALVATALPSRADTIVSIDLSNITYKGNNTCHGTCQDVFNATWQWDETTNSIVAGSMTVSNTGVLGTMAFFASTGFSFQFNSTTPSTYEAVSWYFGNSFPAPGTYALSDLYLYCDLGPCSTEFATDTYLSPSSGKITISTVATTPEPRSLILLASGLLAIAFIAARRSKPNHACAPSSARFYRA